MVDQISFAIHLDGRQAAGEVSIADEVDEGRVAGPKPSLPKITSASRSRARVRRWRSNFMAGLIVTAGGVLT
jgi:hypothetical protein